MDPEDEAQRIGETRILLPAVLCNIVFFVSLLGPISL